MLIVQLRRVHREEQCTHRIKSLSTDDGSFWKRAKVLKTGKNISIFPLHGSWGIVYSLEEKAEIFAESLETIYEGNPAGDSNDEVEEEVRATAARIPLPVISPLRRVTVDEVKEIIVAKKNKAPGSGGIGNRALKELPERASEHLVSVTNRCATFRPPGR